MKPDVKKIIADIKATKGNRKFCNGLAGTLQDDNYASSICKYVKTVTPERIDLLIEYAEKLEAEVTDMAVQLANAESKCRELAAENAYLLNGASRELNTSWMFHKTMLGAQAALVCLTHGYQAAAREWLEGTTDEAGAEIPDDISVGELHEWFESNMVSNGGNSGFLTRKEAEVAIRKECPATDAFLAEVRARAIPSDVMAAIQKVARIRIDLNDFDGDKRGIVDCLGEAEESLIEVVNKFAAQLRKGVEL